MFEGFYMLFDECYVFLTNLYNCFDWFSQFSKTCCLITIVESVFTICLMNFDNLLTFVFDVFKNIIFDDLRQFFV